MAKLSLKSELKKLTISKNKRTAIDQVRKHLEGLGFECDVGDSSYHDNYGVIRDGQIPIVAKRGNKRVAIDIDNKNPRIRTLIKLDNYESDHKLLLLRGGNKDYVENKIKRVDNSGKFDMRRFITVETNISILSLKCNQVKKKTNTQTKKNKQTFNSYEDNYNEYQKRLFNIAYTHLTQTDRVPTLKSLLYTISKNHTGLSKIEGAEEIISKALKEYKEIISLE